MPTETRRLVFSSDELVEALNAHRKLANGKMPEGKIVFCRVGETSDFRVSVKILPPGRSEVQTFHLDGDYVGAALIGYCAQCKIPLPRGAEKNLQACGNNVALNLSLNAATQALPNFVRIDAALN